MLIQELKDYHGSLTVVKFWPTLLHVSVFLNRFREPAFVEPSPLSHSAVPSNEERTHLFISLVKQPDIFISGSMPLSLDVSMNRAANYTRPATVFRPPVI